MKGLAKYAVGVFVYLIARITWYMAAGFAILFYISLYWTMYIRVPPGEEWVTVSLFLAFMLFAVIHCLWMWVFYRVNVLGDIFK